MLCLGVNLGVRGSIGGCPGVKPVVQGVKSHFVRGVNCKNLLYPPPPKYEFFLEEPISEPVKDLFGTSRLDVLKTSLRRLLFTGFIIDKLMTSEDFNLGVIKVTLKL